MGGLVNGLYENDVALDVRDELEAALDDGSTPQEAIAELTGGRFTEYGDTERAVAWMAVADTLLRRGYISEELRRKALEQITWFEQYGIDQNNMMAEAITGLRERLTLVPEEADEEQTGKAELSEVEQEGEAPLPEAGHVGLLQMIKNTIGSHNVLKK